jgi:hypothetical protein
MKTDKEKTAKIVKLRNLYTGDIVFTNKYDTPTSTDGVTFIPVYSEKNPHRVYLVNKQAFAVVPDK